MSVSCLESETGRGSRSRAGDDTSFFFFLCLFFVFTKIISLLFFFHENYFYFFMFRYAPACSGMFRVLSTPSLTVALNFDERSCLSGPPRKLIIMRKAWFPLLGNFYVRTSVKFTLEPRSTSRLFSTLYILRLFYLRDYNFCALTSVTYLKCPDVLRDVKL